MRTLTCSRCGRVGKLGYDDSGVCQARRACDSRRKKVSPAAQETTDGPPPLPAVPGGSEGPSFVEPHLKYMTDEDAARLVETEERVMELRIRGYSFYRIEKELGITHASRVFRRALARQGNIEYKRAEATRLEGERLDALQDGIWDRAMTGDPRSVEVAIKVLERRAKLYGLDFADLVGARLVEIEQAKLDLMVTAFTSALNHAGVSGPKQQQVIDVFFRELRAQEEEAS